MNERKIIQKGDESGNGLIVKFRLPSGLEIVSLPTKNVYGGHWDLGPTWNYVVLADRPFLIDSGRFGQGRHLVEMMRIAGIKPVDLDFVLISHSELMVACGDLKEVKKHCYVATGSENFEQSIRSEV